MYYSISQCMHSHCGVGLGVYIQITQHSLMCDIMGFIIIATVNSIATDYALIVREKGVSFTDSI